MGKKERIKKKSIKMKNKKLLKKYPWLTPRTWDGKILKDYDYTYTYLDEMPDGWRKAFGLIMVDEINERLRETGAVEQYTIQQIKEKFGQLRWYDCGGNTSDIVSKYEVISERVCIRCGKLDVPMINRYGWISPECKKCSKCKDYEKAICDEPDENGEYKIPTEYTIHYLTKGDVTVDISDTLNKIRNWKSYNKGVIK